MNLSFVYSESPCFLGNLILNILNAMRWKYWICLQSSMFLVHLRTEACGVEINGLTIETLSKTWQQGGIKQKAISNANYQKVTYFFSFFNFFSRIIFFSTNMHKCFLLCLTLDLPLELCQFIGEAPRIRRHLEVLLATWEMGFTFLFSPCVHHLKNLLVSIVP